MYRSLKERIHSSSGAAAIEAMGAMIVFLAALLLATYMGITFYNANVLNSAAQNITLNTQVQIDRWCAPRQSDEQRQDCIARGFTSADSISALILSNTKKELAFASAPTAQAVVRPPSTSAVALEGGQSLPAGWGYNSVVLSSQQELIGRSGAGPLPSLQPLTLNARSLSTSYKDPNR